MNIMIELRRIRKNENTIESDIYPEDSTISGHIVVDLSDEKIKEYYLPDGYDYCKEHITMARNRLIKLSKANEMPDKDIIMWY